MTAATMVIAASALLACALVAGVFFAFSSFIMQALARIPASHGIGAMQAINVVVINRWFLGLFFGGALLSLLAAGLAVSQWGSAAAICTVAGAALYLVGTFLVTVLGNVPLNDRLAAVTATDPRAAAVWAHYLRRWTIWNHVRTLGALAAAAAYLAGLLLSGAG
ncbi:MAG: anthrone oxygenase family protein [Burkholderiaceae bacterium]